jgi:predicted methyltransferase
MVVVVNEACEDTVSLETEFAAIGSAANTAKTILFLRDQDSTDSVMDSIYAVYEAKSLSETVPGIGESYSIDVVDDTGTVMALSDKGAQRCKELFVRFGPRAKSTKTKKWFAIKEDYLEPYVAFPKGPAAKHSVPQTSEDKEVTRSDSAYWP